MIYQWCRFVPSLLPAWHTKNRDAHEGFIIKSMACRTGGCKISGWRWQGTGRQDTCEERGWQALSNWIWLRWLSSYTCQLSLIHRETRSSLYHTLLYILEYLACRNVMRSGFQHKQLATTSLYYEIYNGQAHKWNMDVYIVYRQSLDMIYLLVFEKEV